MNVILDSILSTKPPKDSVLMLNSERFTEEDLDNLLEEDDIQCLQLARRKYLPTFTFTFDTAAMYNAAKQEERTIYAAHMENRRYPITGATRALQDYRNYVADTVFFHFGGVCVTRVYEYEMNLLDIIEAPIFKPVDHMYRKTEKTSVVCTADGGTYKGCHYDYVATRRFKCIDRSFKLVFRNISKLVAAMRKSATYFAAYFDEPFELGFEYLDYFAKLDDETSTLEVGPVYSLFDAVIIAENGVFLRDASNTFGDPFFLYIPYEMLYVCSTDKDDEEDDDEDDEDGSYEDSLDDEDEEDEYIDYVDDDGAEEYDDGSHYY